MNTLTLWPRRDPFAGFSSFDGFDSLVRSAFGPAAVGNERTGHGFTPAAEIVRDGDDAVVRVEIPGLDPEKDVTVEIDHGRLVVRGERRDEATREEGGRTLRELRYGSFRRSFGLPEHVSADAVTATYDAGVLSVRVTGAHAAPAAAQRIAVTSEPAATAPAVSADSVVATEATPEA
jgi:HSP20 family protein